MQEDLRDSSPPLGPCPTRPTRWETLPMQPDRWTGRASSVTDYVETCEGFRDTLQISYTAIMKIMELH
ncbi:unnamed protein product [Boreogadus saida]